MPGQNHALVIHKDRVGEPESSDARSNFPRIALEHPNGAHFDLKVPDN
jgi:hypothetical protein